MEIKAIVLMFLTTVLGIVAQAQPQGAETPRSPQISDELMTPLMRAADAGRLDEVRRLLKSGADPNEKLGSLGLTALMFAAGRGHLEVVKVLLESGADPNAAGGIAHVGFFTVMMSTMNRQNKNRLEIVDTLIAAGARLNPPNWFPASPLCSAVSGNDLEMIKALLERGSDVNWENPIRHTALVTAVLVRERNVEVVRLLLDAGADPNKPRLWIGDNCVSILTSLDDWPGMPRDKVKEEIRNLILKAGGKRYSAKSKGNPCTTYHER